MKIPLMAVFAAAIFSSSILPSAWAQQDAPLSHDTSNFQAPASAPTPTVGPRYSERRGLTQKDCPVAWCAPGFQLSLFDSSGQPLVPGMLAGYTHLRVERGVSSVVLTNNRPHRVMVLFSINQKNPLDGKRTVQASRGYVVPALSEMVIEKTKLPGGSWFSDSWPLEGRLQVNLHNDKASPPMIGGPPPHAPPHAKEYITDKNGKRFWVPPHNFVFRHARADLTPSGYIYMTYDIQPIPQGSSDLAQAHSDK